MAIGSRDLHLFRRLVGLLRLLRRVRDNRSPGLARLQLVVICDMGDSERRDRVPRTRFGVTPPRPVSGLPPVLRTESFSLTGGFPLPFLRPLNLFR